MKKIIFLLSMISIGYSETILNCTYNKNIPISVFRENDNYFLKIRDNIIPLSYDRLDMGYWGMSLNNEKYKAQLPGKMKHIQYVYIFNNEEEVDDPNEAQITYGELDFFRDSNFKNEICETLGTFKL